MRRVQGVVPRLVSRVPSVLGLGNSLGGGVRSSVGGVSSHGMRYSGSLLPKTAANYVPLTPLSLVDRCVRLYPDHTAYVVHDKQRDVDLNVTWKELDAKCKKFASSLLVHGLRPLDVVSVLAPNCPVSFDAHYSVLGAKGILHTVNTRLDATSVAFQLKHSKSKFFIVDTELKALAIKALGLLEATVGKDSLPFLVEANDPAYGPETISVESSSYKFTSFEDFILKGTSDFSYLYPEDEWDAACLNYTSGTTGDPKGVVYHHRGAYLNCIANALDYHMDKHPRFMFGKISHIVWLFTSFA
jgi:fatty-acyl-CoA synthase